MDQTNRLAFFSDKTLLGQYTVETVDAKQYMDFYLKVFKHHDRPDTFIDIDAMYDQRFNQHDMPYTALFIKDQNEVVAIFYGDHLTSNQLLMEHSVVSKKYRRQGVYSALLDLIMDYAKFLNVAEILSTHSPANNPIIIAKLKKGFVISGMEIEPKYGLNVNLRYYFDDDVKVAHSLRCGEMTVTPSLLKYSHGTLEQLADVILDAVKS